MLNWHAFPRILSLRPKFPTNCKPFSELSLFYEALPVVYLFKTIACVLDLFPVFLAFLSKCPAMYAFYLQEIYWIAKLVFCLSRTWLWKWLCWVPFVHTYIAVESIITPLKFVSRQLLAFNNGNTKCVGLHRTWVYVRTVSFDLSCTYMANCP